MTNLNSNEKVIENFNLCIGSARSLGCAVSSKPEDLAGGNQKALEDVSWQIIKVFFFFPSS